MNPGNSVISSMGEVEKGSGYFKPVGGNSGCVLSPAPGLGLSAYQTQVPVKEENSDANQSRQ